MNIFVGTSGFSYKEWKGPFYPESISQNEMLSFYSSRLPSVEINNTFYRLPKEDVLATWADQTPSSFRFVLKASRRITHFKRLLNAGETIEYMYSKANLLGDKLGAILYQLPPNFQKNTERLTDFLSHLPSGSKAAIEFRHPSWLDDDVFALLKASNCALCIADKMDDERTPFIATASWGYLRLRRPDYSAMDLENWVTQLSDSNWSDVFVFFKHEDDGAGPKMAELFRSTAAPLIK